MRIGSWSMFASVESAALMASSGADWLVLDAQHGRWETAALDGAIPLLVAAFPEVSIQVRVPSGDPAVINRVLDAGAAGVVVPVVNDAATASAVAAACRYPPLGTRSWGPHASLRGAEVRPPGRANAEVSCTVMIETREAVAHVASIATTPGVDMVFVGPMDLALAYGTTPDELVADRSEGNALDAIVAACEAAGVVAGAFAGRLSLAEALRERGFTALSVTVDSMLLAAHGPADVAAARDALR